MRRMLKKLKTYLGRVYRNFCRKISSCPDLQSRFARLPGLVERLLQQTPKSKNSKRCFVSTLTSRLCKVPRQEFVDFALFMTLSNFGKSGSKVAVWIDGIQFAGLNKRGQYGPVFSPGIMTREE